MEGEHLADKTKESRKRLAGALGGLAQSDEERKALQSFEKGAFMVPSRTIQIMNALMDRVQNDQEQRRLRSTYNVILEEGL